MKEAIARRTEMAMEELISTAERVPEERINWQPNGDARSVLDIIQECGRVNDRWAKILETGKWIPWDPQDDEKQFLRCPNLALSIQFLRNATAKYVQVVRDFPDDRIAKPFESPWVTTTWGEWLMHAMWHMSYHEGQINYIQILYGDWS